MIKIHDLRTTPNYNSVSELRLAWIISDTEEALSKYEFRIERSVDTNDNFEDIGKVSGDSFRFTDYNASGLKRNVIFYYRVTPYDKLTGHPGESKECVSNFNREEDNIAYYIRYVDNVYLDFINNQVGFILSRRKFGQRCPVCWDDIRKQHKKTFCPVCYGTSYVGGYHKPYQVMYNILNSPRVVTEQVTPDDRSNTQQSITAWIREYPMVGIGDIFVNDDNDRYKIVQLQTTTKNNEHILRQVMTLQKLAPTDQAYQISIDDSEVVK